MLQRMMRLLHFALFLGTGGIIVELSLKISKADGYHWSVLTEMGCRAVRCVSALLHTANRCLNCAVDYRRLRSSTTPIINCVRIFKRA